MATRKIWRAERVVLPDGERPAAIAVEDGKVVGILEKDAPWEADEEVIVPDDQALMPGLIDIHVHATNRDARNGKGMRRPPGPPRREDSRPSSTCP